MFVYKNTDGRATQDAEEIRKDLLENLAFPVQWNQMMDLAKELGMDLTIEFPRQYFDKADSYKIWCR